MLCRVADSLFWMSRYIERAENTARLADVNIELLLEMGLGPDEDLHAHWNSYLESLGDHHLFREHYDTFDTRSVAEFFTFSRANPSSVLSCVYAARENARMIRDQISSEMWEIINRLYLFLKQQDPERVLGGRRSDFYQQIGEMSHLFRGITDATFPRQTGYEFIQAGCYLERADKTGRILDTKHHLLEGNEHDDGSTEDAVHWVSVLRTCSALEAYHRVHVGDVLPVQVATFLIMSREFPGSILFSLNQLQLALHAISGCSITLYSNEAERLCGQIISKLVYTSMSDILREGLHAYLGQIEDSLNGIAIEMSRHYMFSPIFDPSEDLTQSQVMSSSSVASP
jgi:uncharacterized alpha-E superfamily protein